MKVLYIAPLPPPITGQALASQILLEELEKDNRVEVVNMSKSALTNGIDSFGRITEVVEILKEVLRKKGEAQVIYLTTSESVAGNFKDLLIYIQCLTKLHRVVIHLHGGSMKKLLFDRSWIIAKINQFFIKRLGGVVILGESHREIFSGWLDRRKLHVVPNFAEDYLFARERQIVEKFKNPEPLRILFMSNLIIGKGYGELLDAFKGLADGMKERIALDFCGAVESEQLKEKFLEDIKPHGQVRYHGVVSGTQKNVIFSRAHVLCLPSSLNEGQPICILEGYAAGCVVMSTDCGGIGDIFKEGVNGFLIEAGSAESIRRVIERMLQDLDQLLPLALANRELAHNQYRTTCYTSSLKKIFEKVAYS